MKVIFLQDVPNVAKPGDVKIVSDGYARNYLIPHKLALAATSSSLSLIESQRKTVAKKLAREEAQTVETGNVLEGKNIVIKAKIGAEGRLHGAITSTDIAAALEKATGITVDKRKIDMAEPIHNVGSYDITIKLGKEVNPKIKLNVEEEKA
jgi:large subunit ribosomal protein L9